MILPEQVLAEANRIGAMPPCLPKLMALLGSDDVDLVKVEAILSGEPVLVAALLRRANSSAFGARVEIGTVRDAVMRLGAPTALSVLVEVCMRGQKHRPEAIYGVAPDVLWQLSITASLVAREIYLGNPGEFNSTVVTAALLHDVGRLSLANLMGKGTMRLVVAHKNSNKCSLVEAERFVAGIDGCTAGALVATEWGFPEPLVHAIGGWAEPNDARSRMVDAVHVSAVVARMIAAAAGVQGLLMRPEVAAAKRLGLDRESIAAITARVTKQYAEVAAEAAPAQLDV